MIKCYEQVPLHEMGYATNSVGIIRITVSGMHLSE